MNVYVVEAQLDRERIDRYVVVAENAAQAEEWAAKESNLAKDEVVAGRLGPYQPGITGASMSRGHWIAVQRIGQR